MILLNKLVKPETDHKLTTHGSPVIGFKADCRRYSACGGTSSAGPDKRPPDADWIHHTNLHSGGGQTNDAHKQATLFIDFPARDRLNTHTRPGYLVVGGRRPYSLWLKKLLLNCRLSPLSTFCLAELGTEADRNIIGYY